MRGSCSGCDAAIMEFSAGAVRLSTLGDFQTCRSWKMWNFFGDFAYAVTSCIATNELGRAHVAMKQWGRHASHLPTDRLRRFIFSVSPCPRLHAFTEARVVLRTSRRFCPTSGHRSQFRSLRIGRARKYAACFDPIVGGNQQEEENMKIASLIAALVATAALTAFA